MGAGGQRRNRSASIRSRGSAAPSAALPLPHRPAASYAGGADLDCDMLVLGAGPGGYSAAFRAADLGHEGGAGRALRHARRRLPERRLHPVQGAAACGGRDGRGQHMADLGVSFGAPQVDIDKLRGHKEKVVANSPAVWRDGQDAQGHRRARLGSFVDPHHVQVEETSGDAQAKTGEKPDRRFKNAIIAAGSQAVRLPFCRTTPHR
jgi:dihydrolipoamide dehydrogenase